jgi:hypothetical protein
MHLGWRRGDEEGTVMALAAFRETVSWGVWRELPVAARAE